jgi:hypothetical protein
MTLFALFDWLAQWLVTIVFGLTLESHLGAGLRFFLYGVPKVMTLLLCISLLPITPPRSTQISGGFGTAILLAARIWRSSDPAHH